MRTLWRAVGGAWLAMLALLLTPPLALGTHGPDQHSANMQLRSMLPPAIDPTQPEPHFQSDFAFWGDLLYAGNYDGFRIIDIADPSQPAVLSDVKCRGPQGDPSVWRNRLLIVSVDTPQLDDNDPATPRGACTTDVPPTNSAGDREGTLTPPAQGAYFEGIRIFDVSNPAAPRLIKGVDTDCGSHTHTLVPDLAHDRLLAYVSSYPLRWGPICGRNTSGRDGEVNPLHDQISVVEIPLAHPEAAHVISEPKLHSDHPVYPGSTIDPAFADHDSRACHDISVSLPLRQAAAACMSDGELWDISDPAHPKTATAKATDRPEVEFWHSATFSWDGKYVVYGDESVGGSCNTPDEPDGRLWLYHRSNIKNALSSFLIPRPQGGDYCSAHLFNFLPFSSKQGYVLTSSWYNGGVSIIDWTKSQHPQEIGYYDRNEGEHEEGFWTGYWYDRHPYGNHIEQGAFFFDFLSPLTGQTMREDHLNPQLQEFLISHSGKTIETSAGRDSKEARGHAGGSHGRSHRVARSEIAGP
jgi:hypothetical protein